MNYTAWLYHKQHGAQIFEGSEAVAQALADGWVDNPAKLDEPQAKGPDPLPVPPEIAGMGKDTLAAFALEKYGMNLDKRSGLDKLLEQVAAKMSGVV